MIEPALLSDRMLFDSGVMSRALGWDPSSPDSQTCVDLFGAVIAMKYSVLLAAPSLAEIIRKDGKRIPPRRRELEIVDFDEEAAVILGQAFPAEELKQLTAPREGSYFKYDAMIMACAKRHIASCVVTLNTKDFAALGRLVGLNVSKPSDFVRKAASMPTAAPSQPGFPGVYDTRVPKPVVHVPMPTPLPPIPPTDDE